MRDIDIQVPICPAGPAEWGVKTSFREEYFEQWLRANHDRHQYNKSMEYVLLCRYAQLLSIRYAAQFDWRPQRHGAAPELTTEVFPPNSNIAVFMAQLYTETISSGMQIQIWWYLADWLWY